MKKKVIGIVAAIVVVLGLSLVVYNQIIPNEYVPADDEIALHLQFDTEEDIGLLVYDYRVDSHEYSGGISNADGSLIKRDADNIVVLNKEELNMEFARLREGVLQQFTPRREILFAGQPFQAPENYLRNAELDLEGKKGNYNMIDGIVNNDPPIRADLTDGQTHEEVKELAPETLPNEKPSIMEKLRADRTEHEVRSFQPSPPERGL